MVVMRSALFLLVLFTAGQAQAQWNNNWVFKTIREQKQAETSRPVQPAMPLRRAAPPAPPTRTTTPPASQPRTGATETVSPAIGPMPAP